MEGIDRQHPVQGHDYDHIQGDQYMFTFPTSSADLTHEVKSKTKEVASSQREEREEGEEGAWSGGMSLVPQPSLYYSIPVECDASPVAFTVTAKDSSTSKMGATSNCTDTYDYEDIID